MCLPVFGFDHNPAFRVYSTQRSFTAAGLSRRFLVFRRDLFDCTFFIGIVRLGDFSQIVKWRVDDFGVELFCPPAAVFPAQNVFRIQLIEQPLSVPALIKRLFLRPGQFLSGGSLCYGRGLQFNISRLPQSFKLFLRCLRNGLHVSFADFSHQFIRLGIGKRFPVLHPVRHLLPQRLKIRVFRILCQAHKLLRIALIRCHIAQRLVSAAGNTSAANAGYKAAQRVKRHAFDLVHICFSLGLFIAHAVHHVTVNCGIQLTFVPHDQAVRNNVRNGGERFFAGLDATLLQNVQYCGLQRA